MNRQQRAVLSAITVAMITGCTAETGDLKAYVEQVKSTVQVNIEPYPEFKQQTPFNYAASNLRSPFVRPKEIQQQVVEVTKANCLQPNYQRTKEPLETFGIDAIAMSGIFSAGDTDWVLFKTNDGGLHKATIGNHLGLFHGKITAITNDTVTITELLPDGAGCWQQKQTTLTMASLAGENDNV